MDTIRKADSRRGRIAYEVAGLAWLAEASDPGAAVVSVLDHGATWLEEPRLVSVTPTPRAAEEFGRALAHTHAAGASHLGAPPPGFEGDGWMGEARLSLPDRPSPAPASSRGESWGAFYARERIAPYAYAPIPSTATRWLSGCAASSGSTTITTWATARVARERTLVCSTTTLAPENLCLRAVPRLPPRLHACACGFAEGGAVLSAGSALGRAGKAIYTYLRAMARASGT